MNTLKKEKPKLTFSQIWNMSFGFLGIQFGFALQNANVSRIFETLGANVDDIPILWVAAPLTGLIIQPIIGYFSDRTWGKLGRRRPYFLVGAILASLALFIMPNSPTLWFAAMMLWIMDASINVSMEPFRAFVGDNLPSSQRTTGFAMQSFFIGVGAVVASALPWILTNWFGVNNMAAENQISDSVKWSFYIGGAIFFLAVLWTVINSKEYSPEELASYEGNESENIESEYKNPDFYVYNSKKQISTGLTTALIGLAGSFIVNSNGLDKQLFVLTGGVLAVGLFYLVSGFMQKTGNYKNGFVTIINDLGNMPKTMIQLAVVQFFSWFALFAMWIYTTSAVTSHIYQTTDKTSKLYNDGADWVGVLFSSYNGIAALVAFLLPLIATKTSRKFTHTLCLILGGLGLISFYFIQDPKLLFIPMIGVGAAWASILSAPYAILSGALPASKMGYFMGVFNFFIVIPQLVAASILGFMIKSLFNSESIYALIIGGVSMIIAGICCMILVDDKDDN